LVKLLRTHFGQRKQQIGITGWRHITLQTIDERHWDTAHWIRLTQLLLLLPLLLLLLPIPIEFLALLSNESLFHKKRKSQYSSAARNDSVLLLTSPVLPLPVMLSPTLWELDFWLYCRKKLG
jgi:hypothetical protein